MSKTRYGNSVIYKFLVAKTAKLVKDSRGRLKYSTYFDNIIYDIFGVKHFTKKINESYDNRDIIDVLELVGSDQLMKIMNNAKLYEAMRDLIAINYRMDSLRKDIRKQSKKDKRNKADLKEYKYLTNLYEDSIKYFRKKLGIKNSKNSYKRRYKSLNNMVREEYDYDDDEYTSILLRGDDEYYFDNDDDYEYDDEYDDYESTSELEDFVNRMNGKRDIRKSRRSNREDVRRYNPRRYSDDEDFDLDDEDDDEYEDDDDNLVVRRGRSSIPSMDDPAINQLNKLTEVVTELSGAVQALMTKNEYDTIQRRKEMYQNQFSGRHPEESTIPSGRSNLSDSVTLEKEVEIITDFIGKLSMEQNKMKENQKTIARSLDEVAQTQRKIVTFLQQFVDDEDDYEEDISEDSIMRAPVVSGNDDLVSAINKYPDVYESMAEDDASDAKMTVGDLIDEINNSGDTTTHVEATKEVETKKVVVETNTAPSKKPVPSKTYNKR